ncbi:hypothetical protein GIB67_004526 [Kingdonia uniflora]|uniref:IREH1/IRE-like N-terminal domain-containing protein n=1 Tax=Kingdonia uniflora TaxID=39325 RepID=A0A7J7NKG5_9MAGN|nr:hypothetical protein GIB67_004526 [Kingdonia uniflora]
MADNQSSPDDPESSSAATTKLRKIPPIPIRRKNTDSEDEDDDEDLEGSSPILASSLGLNHIRTRSAAFSAPSPTRLPIPAFSPLNPINDKKVKIKDGNDDHPKSGRKNQWIQSKSLRAPSTLKMEFECHRTVLDTAKEIQSPRFQAILRVTSGRRKRTPADVKSFSHELNSKGVRPFPFWKSRALGHPEEIMGVIRTKFDRLKEEVNSDLSILAGDLVGILEKNAESHPEWKETLEDLLVVARQVAMMSPGDFWVKCEGIVQNLDDRRQELPLGILKQAHSRILFILTRCTRLLQFQKEGIFEDEHILGLHQLSDLGVYPDQIFRSGRPTHISSFGREVKKSAQSQEHSSDDQNSNSSQADPAESGTAKSVDSGRERISSWKKLPSAAEKNLKKDTDENEAPPRIVENRKPCNFMK